jgi:integrase
VLQGLLQGVNMGVKIRERALSSGEIAFYIDTYHKYFGRFSRKTGLQVNPKNRKEYRDALSEVQDQVRQIEKELQRDPAAVFDRKAKAASDFIEYFKGFSDKHNYSRYQNVYKVLRDYSGGVLPFGDLNSMWLEKFKSHLLTIKTLSNNTAGNYLVGVKTVIKKAFREGYITNDFTVKVSGIKKSDVQRHFLTVEQISNLYETECKNEMVKLAFLFACFSGLRLSDIENLQWDQINLINGAPYYRFQQKKTSRYENLPMTEQAVKILERTKAIHPEYAPSGSNKIFILPCRSRMCVILETWSIRAGLPFRLHFHVSRHSFATMSLTFGCDLYTLSKLLGHRGIKTTQIYGQIIDQKKLDAVRSLPVISFSEKPYKQLNTRPSPNAGDQIKPSETVPEEVQMSKNSISRALQAEGERVAKALKLQKNEQGLFAFEGRHYTAIELALDISGE